MGRTDWLDDVALADQLAGRALALALAPGLDPILAATELAELSGGDQDSLLDARTRIRRTLKDGPGNATLQLAIDLLDEAVIALSAAASGKPAAVTPRTPV